MKTRDILHSILEEKKIDLSSSKEEKILQRIESSLEEINVALKKGGYSLEAIFNGISMIENDISWTLSFEIKESHFIN